MANKEMSSPTREAQLLSHNNAPLPRAGRLDYLDALRALAALAVAYLHGSLEMMPLAGPAEHSVLHTLVYTFDPGKIGVVMFFMVSGFIIPNSLKVNRPRMVGIRDFLIGRLFRLYPAYWLSMLAAFFVFFSGSFALCSVKRILFNATMLQGFFANQNVNMVGVYWTLQIEWAFYILCVLLYAFNWLNQPRKILAAYAVFMGVSLAMAVVRYETHRALPLAAPLGLAVMFAANLWRMVVLDKRADVARHMRMAFGSFAVLMPLIAILGYNFDAGHEEHWYRYVICYGVAMASFALLTTKVKLRWKPLVILGQASYSFYLFNEIFVTLFRRVVPARWFTSIIVTPYVLMGIATAALMSVPIYWWLEKPLIALGRKLVRKFEYPKPSAVDNSATQYV